MTPVTTWHGTDDYCDVCVYMYKLYNGLMTCGIHVQAVQWSYDVCVHVPAVQWSYDVCVHVPAVQWSYDVCVHVQAVQWSYDMWCTCTSCTMVL